MNKLERYKEVGEAALKDAGAYKKDFTKDPINWGDLHCIDVEKYEGVYGDKGIRIYIEEAAPDSTQLITFIRNYFAQAGLVAPDVVCQW